jgi:hypothetical protein
MNLKTGAVYIMENGLDAKMRGNNGLLKASNKMRAFVCVKKVMGCEKKCPAP